MYISYIYVGYFPRSHISLSGEPLQQMLEGQESVFITRTKHVDRFL